MSTFGGTDSGNLGYTEALLTIRRSFAIQDNINPYTGRVAGFNQSAIDDFKTENGSGAISILETLYQTFNEDTLNIGALPNTVEGGRFNVVKQDMEDGLTYAEKLKYVRSNYFGDNGSKDRVSDSRIGGLLDFIVKLYDKTKPLLYNEQVHC